MNLIKFEKHQIHHFMNLETFYGIDIISNAYIRYKQNSYHVTVFAEVQGVKLNYDLVVLISLFDVNNQLIEERFHKIEAQKFDGIDSFKITFYIENREVRSIKVCPFLHIMMYKDYVPGLFPVVGIRIPERVPFVSRIKVGDEVQLIREPDNAYDPFAIKVLDLSGNKLGYIEREHAFLVSTLMDTKLTGFKAEVKSIKRSAFFVKASNETELLNALYDISPKSLENGLAGKLKRYYKRVT